jgi:pyroglutamyl-peptidase
MRPVRAFALAALVFGCSSSSDDGGSLAEPKLPRDALPDGLYHDFLDGKYDGAGHPIGAQVWQAEAGCAPETGTTSGEWLALDPERHAAATACNVAPAQLALGRFTLNVRALVEQGCDGAACDATVLALSVLGADGATIAAKAVPWRAFVAPLTYQNVSLAFSHTSKEPVRLVVSWPAEVAARLDYVELFRSNRNLVVTPPSGILAPDARFQVELQDPPQGFSLAASCNGLDRSAELAQLLSSGAATRTDTDFRALFEIPASPLLADCSLPSRVSFQVKSGDWVRETSRVTIYAEQPPCTFTPGTIRVLLTGFEPFPADSRRDNSSEQAVGAFDPAAIPGISVMRLTLPVEFDTAPEIVVSAIERCQPEIVVGFGQGRNQVDLETTAYNLKDSSEIAGGVPDNRGIIGGGEPILAGGAAELFSGLPLDAVRARIAARGIAVGASDDPGRYVCNNLFYRIATASAAASSRAGFVHLPRIASVDAEARELLRTVVTETVSASVAALAETP